ncbi:hypothetical protein [Cyclobacterium qasimii]|uniref:Outer membrane protein beta-barrel domain-containing protein n=1 Tax=Cyclobacterium qasimii TaxID=1350429 RepID=A0A512CBY7_9BACT|nr:hypothetical protein [Cyclobacterium qasimii]GEO21713.1 hypothetical protein CQA01_22470 [Cyclobacterium qasimii]
MKYALSLLLILFSFASYAQQHQLGIRIGDPYGITYKTPVKDKFSFEAILGRGSQNSSQYYRRTFENNRPVSSARYFGHQVSGAFSLHARGIYEESFSDDFNISEGDLTVYAGLGLQFRSVNIDYFYTTPNATPNTPEAIESRTNMDFGPEVLLGTAYYFEDLPISVFLEVGFMTEIVDRLHLKAQGAIGARYLFGN